MTVSLFSRDHKPTTGQTTKFEAQPRFRFFPCIAAASEEGPLYAPPLYSFKHVGRPGAASPSDDEADGSTCSPHPLHISLSRDPRLQATPTPGAGRVSASKVQGSLPRRECKVGGKTREVPNGPEGLLADLRHAPPASNGPSHSPTAFKPKRLPRISN